MRWIARLVLGTVLAALAAVPGIGDEYTLCGDKVHAHSCGYRVYAQWEESKVSVSLPLSGIAGTLLKKVAKVAAKVAGVLDLIVPDLILRWTLTDTLITGVSCTCLPEHLPCCCSGRNARASALLNLFQTVSPPVEYFGRAFPPQGKRFSVLTASGANWRPSQGVGGTDLCGWPGAVELSVHNYTGRLDLDLGVDLPFGIHKTSVSLDVHAICQCNPLAGCTEEHAPLLSTDSAAFVVPAGETRQFLVSVSDSRGDVQRVDVSGTESGAAVEGYVYDTQGNIVAKLRIPYGLDKVRVMATDKCGQTTEIEVPVISVHRPKITVVEADWQKYWKGWVYTVTANVTDRDLYAACFPPWTIAEWLGLTAESSGGGKFLFVPGNAADLEVDCPHAVFELEDSYVPVRLQYLPPSSGAIPRQVTLSLTATDAWGFSEKWTGELINGIPSLWIYESFPPASSPIRIPFGAQVHLTLSFRDLDGDWLELRQVRGPGTFRVTTRVTTQEMSTVEGIWSWTAYSRQRYWLVEFECQDYVFPGGPPYEGPARAMFLLEIIQPPRPYSDSAWVNRGVTERTSLYVHDPDSYSHSFAFLPPPGISVQVVGQHEPRDEDGAWGGLSYEVEVSVDRTLCPGAYPVPFTVTDPDGNSSQATLTAYVRGNQPPQASPPHLRGETTVTLTPGGVVRGPLVMSTPKIWDPEGDTMTVHWGDLPPMYAQ